MTAPLDLDALVKDLYHETTGPRGVAMQKMTAVLSRHLPAAPGAVAQALYDTLDSLARDVDCYEYGLPMFNNEPLLAAIESALAAAREAGVQDGIAQERERMKPREVVLPNPTFDWELENTTPPAPEGR